MDIELIRLAARQFLGMHDFRNFCKKDNSAGQLEDDDEQNFLRRIYQFDIIQVDQDCFMALIKGSAFLWH